MRAMCVRWQEVRGQRFTFSCECSGEGCPDEPRPPIPCPICGDAKPHGLHVMHRDGSIEGLPMVGGPPTIPFCERCGHHAAQHDQFRRCRACACSDFTDGLA